MKSTWVFSHSYRLLVFTTVALVGAQRSAEARAAGGEDPRPFALPWSVLTDLAGAEAALLHAASLAFAPRLELALFGQLGKQAAGEPPATAFGGVFSGRLGPLSAGFGLSGVSGPRDGGALGTRADLGLAWRLSDGAALGAQWRWLSHRDGGPLDAWWSWALSATLRPGRAVALAAQVDRLNAPRDEAGARGEPVARVTLGLRPFGEAGSLSFEGARTLGDGAWEAGLATRWWLASGLTLGLWGRAGWRDTDVNEPFWSAGVTLGLSQGHLGVEGGFRADRDGDSGGSALVRLRSDPLPSLTSGRPKVLRLSVDGPVPERPSHGLGASEAGFAHGLLALERAARDPEVAGVLLQIGGSPGWAQCWELRQAVARLQAAGKKVVASLVGGDMRAMYLAAAADQVWLYAAGSLRLTGLSVTRSYYRDLLQLLGVDAEFIALEQYKSYPEIATRTGPSEAATEQTRRALTLTRDAWQAAVSTGRRLTPERLSELVSNGPQSMEDARSSGLVDALVEADGYGERLSEVFGPHELISQLPRGGAGAARWGGEAVVAILPVVGSMVDGDSAGASPLPIPFTGGPTTGDRSFIAALEAAVRDPQVAGVVVRVDSGGGSVTAADRMHRAVRALSKVKPIVVSFGDVAASGGYYLAAGAGRILASPLTLTGSIGIFTGKVNLSGLWARLGVSQHTERTDARADMLGDHRGLTPEERARAEEVLRVYYQRFLTVVGEGRKLSPEATRAAAQGRVWLGSDALERGLVDEHGGLVAAILAVAREAGLGDAVPRVRYVGTVGGLSGVGRLLAGAGVLTPGGATLTPGILGDALDALGAISAGVPLARLPFTWRLD